jgi:hypothetical protein
MTEHECERLDWTSVRVDNEFAGGAHIVVEGDAPEPMRVELHPLPVGVAPEEYQGVEVCGFRDDFGPKIVTHFKVEKNTQELPSGTVGIVLIGATMREYIPPKDS